MIIIKEYLTALKFDEENLYTKTLPKRVYSVPTVYCRLDKKWLSFFYLAIFIYSILCSNIP